MNKPMLIFDLDGTLWDSGESVAESWNVVFARPKWRAILGECVLTGDDIHSVMGMTMKDIAFKMFAGVDPENRRELLRDAEAYEIQYITERGGVLYPGVRETLEALQAEGYPLAIVSNCQAGYIEAFLTSMNMHSYFCDWEEWGRTGMSKADNIRLVMERGSADRAFYIGDIQKDCDSTHEAGLPFIHASYGFGTATDPEYVIKSFSEILELAGTFK